ncbi:unnamed protein product [Didymodactylos carnosus]|uniref:Uncharacterized protein n=1 Tax=Didymodactylos carnosus TaxID=1234261 RepID=A0A814VB29_9BILA|nr:unnamed protein product [Didymodactylos carnosus]CAF1539000.1 unnamed protein product [Didymodactylos carnosus]CAF3952891.1 unnamed protein product [Didymodactylos carnosus]CAF4327025.1 unnamed protein product [Didymodactylos carnosus]
MAQSNGYFLTVNTTTHTSNSFIVNTTMLSNYLLTSTAATANIYSTLNSRPHRTRAVINAIYIIGIAFMMVIFFLLLYVNLHGRRCWIEPSTSHVNRRSLLRRKMQQDRNDDGDE